MAKVLESFVVGMKLYGLKHYVSTDWRELQDETGETLLMFSPNLEVMDEKGRRGNIQLETIEGKDCWVYYERPLQTRIVYGDDLTEAELAVCKRFIERTGLACA